MPLVLPDHLGRSFVPEYFVLPGTITWGMGKAPIRAKVKARCRNLPVEFEEVP